MTKAVYKREAILLFNPEYIADIDTSDFEDCDWDAVEELRQSRSYRNAVKEVRETLGIDKAAEAKRKADHGNQV